ncbi:MAG: hypothetical protein DBO99_18970 [gamma proteobacterium symbiont of Ctena orbiculata]|nr:MAG: hypothetical protein DBO99_18970 [gamma proteobacterium symbiont of Ctena orbiculata]
MSPSRTVSASLLLLGMLMTGFSLAAGFPDGVPPGGGGEAGAREKPVINIPRSRREAETVRDGDIAAFIS